MRLVCPRAVIDALAAAQAHVVIIGQVAGIMHGSAELTGDLDLLWDGDPTGRAALAEGFRAAGAELYDDDGSSVSCEPVTFELLKITFRSDSACGDCCTPNLPWANLPIGDFIRRSLIIRSNSGHPIRYLQLDDLVAMREAAGRPKDLRRARELRALRTAP
jgi:hypothetical protein